jgi:hypothetical protein
VASGTKFCHHEREFDWTFSITVQELSVVEVGRCRSTLSNPR